jgi:hypothetical protein
LSRCRSGEGQNKAGNGGKRKTMKLEEIKNKTQEATDYLVQSLEAGHSEVLTEYLGAMAKFHTYSFGNIMLIARQKPSATNVAGVRTWNSLGRFVRRGEKGILILAPMVGRKTTNLEETTGEEMRKTRNPSCTAFARYMSSTSARPKAKTCPR